MHYHKLFHQLYNELCSEADFPVSNAEKLWSILPKGSRDLAAAIYLLPFGEDPSDIEKARAKVCTLLTLSAFTHGDLERNHAYTDGEAVLYGDYLFALAFSLLPEELSPAEAEKLLERSYGFSENRLRHKITPTKAEDYIAYARSDYGSLLKDLAKEGADRSGMQKEEKEHYILCAEALGTAWGILCEKYPAAPSPLWREAKAHADQVTMRDSLYHIINEQEGADGEHHS